MPLEREGKFTEGSLVSLKSSTLFPILALAMVAIRAFARAPSHRKKQKTRITEKLGWKNKRQWGKNLSTERWFIPLIMDLARD